MNKRKVEKKPEEETAKEKILNERGRLSAQLFYVVRDYPASTEDELRVLSEMEEVDFERALVWLISDEEMSVFTDKHKLHYTARREYFDNF